jgi:hypothetical protein
MKPRLFIGSSVENLYVAQAIQANLEYDAIVTLWNQGIFNLSSTTLVDLLDALNNFDFAIFIFLPNDITNIRNNNFHTVRDNVIFELGLFLGRLGKERVFYLTDRDTKQLHLPTDLLGFKSGSFDSKREDGNIKAALGPFCFDVSNKLKVFLLENLADLQDESVKARRIVLERPEYWEFDLAIELFSNKLKPINDSYLELNNDTIVQRKTNIDYKETFRFIRSTLASYTSFIEQFKLCLEELNGSFGPPGIPGDALAIKKSIDHTIAVCKAMIALEFEINSLSLPNGLEEIKPLMKGWSKTVIEAVDSFPTQLSNMVKNAKKGERAIPINFVLTIPPEAKKITTIFENYIYKNKITDLLI